MSQMGHRIGRTFWKSAARNGFEHHATNMGDLGARHRFARPFAALLYSGWMPRPRLDWILGHRHGLRGPERSSDDSIGRLAMRFFASLRDVPELKDLTEHERLAVHRVCIARAMPSGRWTWASAVTGFCAGMAAGLGCLVAFLGWSPPGVGILWLCCANGAGMGGALAGVIHWQWTVNHLRPFYAEYIRTELRRAVL